MKRLMISLALTCVFSFSVMAGEMPTCGVASPGDIPTGDSASPGEIPTDGLAVLLTIIDLAF